jgi:Flp pilus assembly protein TadG
MGTNWIVASLRNAVRRFRGDTGGNTVLTFSLALLPIMGLIGAAYDYSRASSIRTAMQAASDITALKLAQNASTDTSLSQDANTYFLAVFTNKAAKNASATATYTNTNGGTVVVTATASYTPLFMGVMNLIKQGPRVTSISLSTSSTANWSTARLRVALVLDNTGSMAQSSKLTTLQTALTSTSSTTPGLLTQLKNAVSTPGDVYVSIIPFVKDVNLGQTNYPQPWVYWDDSGHTDNTSWDAQNGTCSVGNYSDRQSCVNSGAGTCSIQGYTTKSTCQAATGSCNIVYYTTQSSCQGASGCSNTKSADNNRTSCLADGYCSLSSHHSSNSCGTNGGTWYSQAIWGPGTWTSGVGVWTAATWTPNDHSTWNGCVMDRGSPTAPGNAAGNDETVTAPTANDSTTQYPAEQYSMCPTAAVMGLNYDWTSMTTLVNSMTANGNTNQAIGLELGWMSLVGGGPFTMPAEDPSYTYQHYIIILTDGLNTQDRWYGTSDNCSKGSTNLTGSPLMCMDQREAQLCDNIKKGGTITIYAIQVDTDNEGTSALLQYCSGSVAGQGDPTHAYWKLTSASQITATFSQIGSQISKLHIAK